MAVEWMVCAVCGERKRPVYSLDYHAPDPKRKFGEHEHNNKCPGSDQPPAKVYWGTSGGSRLPE